MDENRLARVTAAVRAIANSEGRPVAVRHICQACATVVRAAGVGLYLIGDLGLVEPLYATDEISDRVMDIQVTVGEGPGVEALDDLCPILAPELTRIASMHRWPGFTPAAVEAGALAVFAFPLARAAVAVGVLEVYRVAEGELSEDEIRDALLLADLAVSILVDQIDVSPTADEAEELTCGIGARWQEIHQAVAVVSTELGSGLTEAFLRLRARAFASSRSLAEIADDVLTRRIRFFP